ncbi:Uncharacterized protein PECH_007812 [Penicillium ucsense]|uniref:DUF1765-domain-containing protein n=1 Tax=Penicillium ucsense TaxID=2839758 RepID=A0A8J8W244_9EURO|nr:Uncharacterized protein PECM_007669 [Penicillium ucsense]KAF7734627.1 Uncharacterized protein PECH_007812 [Penicillium ucsense]
MSLPSLRILTSAPTTITTTTKDTTTTTTTSRRSSIYPSDDDPLITRAASFTDLPSQSPTSTPPGLRRTFSDCAVPALSDSPTKETVAAGKDILRRTSLRAKKPERFSRPVSHFTLSSTEDLKETVNPPQQDGSEPTIPETRAPEPVARPLKTRSMSGRIVSLARKPWGSASRSPSPAPKRSKQILEEQPPTRSSDQRTDSTEHGEGDTTPTSRRRSMLYKRPRRPMVAVVSKGNSDSPDSPNSPSQSLRNRTSLERFTASLSISTPILPPMPKGAAKTVASYVNIANDSSVKTSNSIKSNDRLENTKKDELWGMFRGLEADFQKFQTKSSALKANVIRSSLLPFLSRHHLHSSCKNLRPEDLDRRINILNKWWIGMLEMLNGKHNQSISGTDRPVYLEAVVGIMSRPEWRIPYPSTHQDGDQNDSLKYASTSVSEASDGSASSGSDFLVESIHHNIRNIFVQNLVSQMVFVVERMSMRHAPASLVAFCGKACAYAFFFCPGVADQMVRLWKTPTAVFRRLLAETPKSPGEDMRAFTDELASNFPLAIRPLAFHSHAPLLRYMRTKPEPPLNTTNIPWRGPWIARWCGRDTDLFFVFLKYIHILYAEYTPTVTAKERRIFAPGLLMVHAQLVVAIEDTIFKQSVQQPETNHIAAAVTFDDLMESPDVSAASHSLMSGRNSQRPMAENRLIILLRDFLSDASSEPNRARLFYAESFCGLLKIAAQRISLFDHRACFLLCDFLEEIIPIVARYSQSIETQFFDWAFWLDVCRQMMQSHNSLTEVRALSFLYIIWPTWTAANDRKAGLCLGFLLHEPVFYHYFYHWSPMVRAYFHRLLCWRVGRFQEDPSSLDSLIYETLSDRLLRVWEYYIGFQSKAAEGLTAPLSSAPCTPAPGRRIIIIRCENQLSPVNLFVSFDRVIPPARSDQISPLRRPSPSTLAGPDTQLPKRRWGLLRSMFSSSSKQNEASGSSSSDDPDGTSEDSPTSPQSQCVEEHEKAPKPPVEEPVPPKITHQPYFFKFSLEWMDRPCFPAKNKRLFRPCLPVASQLHVQQCRSRSPTASVDFETASETVSTDDTSEQSTTRSDKQSHIASSHQSPVTTQSSPVTELASVSKQEYVVASKYAGRALAEWAYIVSECDSFFARRRDEGVPSDRAVETPSLGVESFRK